MEERGTGQTNNLREICLEEEQKIAK